MVIEVIKFLQRALNTGSLERYAAGIGVKIPVGALIKNLLLNIVPVGGAQIYDYINRNLQDFKTKPAEQIAAELEAGGGKFVIKEGFNLDLFGKQIRIEPDNAEKFKQFLGYGLTGLLLIFLFTRGK